MPSELVLRLRVDPLTGRREVVVDYTSDADALPYEHENEHRRLAGKVMEGGLDGNNLEVTRPVEEPSTQLPAGEEPVKEGVKGRG
jgi:hypothetical protein